MGAWGVGIYDNDDAADWTFEIADGGVAFIEATLRAAAAPGYLEAPTAACALAAADVVARLQRGDVDEPSAYATEVTAWVAANQTRPPAELVTLADQIIDRVRGDESELAELWADGDDLPGWLTVLTALQARLRPAP